MRYSQMLIPTVKQVPADAEIPSHQLMLRAGLIRKLASGTYTYLPLGFRCLQKVIKIVREEMNKSGAQEILMPAIQPIELWQQTGRDVDYGETMAKFTDRHGRLNVIAPTAEEVVTSVAAGEINSYKQLPMNIYQISFKFRDEFRPRFGVLRSREFIMKDAYSFHADLESLDETYKLMYDTYGNIFTRCGLDFVIVEAESGEMGGSGSHQFTIPCENGEDTIVYTEDGSYAANLEKAAVDPLPKQKANAETPPPEEIHTPNVGSIEAVCDFLKTKPEDMIKTLIYTTYTLEDHAKAKGEYEAVHPGQPQRVGEARYIGYYAVLVRGDHDVNEEKLIQVLGGKHVGLLDREDRMEKITGAKIGFAGPVGFKTAIPLIIDHAIAAMTVGVTGANKTDYHVKNIVPGRDFPLEGEKVTVADIRNAVEGDTYEGKKLLFKRGIEVGQVFKLGTKYSQKLNAKFLDENGSESPCLMGTYGIGINRIIASAVEISRDKNGIIFPISIAPFEVIITSANPDDKLVADTAEKIYKQLLQKGIDVLLDDRPLRAGVKFKDADLIGIPLRITVGQRALADGNVELKLRSDSESTNVPADSAAEKTIELVNSLKQKLKP